MSLRSLSLRTIFLSVLALVALAIPAAAGAAPKEGAVVFSWTNTVKGVEEGGLFAVRGGHENQLTEDPADAEPSFSPDGRTVAFAREGHIYTVRPDGSGEREITKGSAIDSRPQISPNDRYVLFERRGAQNEPSHLYTVPIGGGATKPLFADTAEDVEARFSTDGSKIVFVRRAKVGGKVNDDLYSVRPNGSGLTRLTKTTNVDEFDPRYFAGGIVFSRGNQAQGAAGFADIYTMKANGAKVKPLVRGAGSAYVEDVSPQGKTLIFRRDRGLWMKPIGPKRGKKIAELPDGAQTNSVFSSNGKSVATLVETKEGQELVSINLTNDDVRELASIYDEEGSEGSEASKASFGPVIDWQPVR
jgi:Tol biopolymer transport system component